MEAKRTLIFRSSVDYDRIRCSTAEYMPTTSSETRINTRNVYGMMWRSRNCNLRRNKFPLSVCHTYCVPDKGRKSGLSQTAGGDGDGTASISIPRKRNELNGFRTTLSLPHHLQANNTFSRGEREFAMPPTCRFVRRAIKNCFLNWMLPRHDCVRTKIRSVLMVRNEPLFLRSRFTLKNQLHISRKTTETNEMFFMYSQCSNHKN